jgi:CRP-like cAMP-binding protein
VDVDVDLDHVKILAGLEAGQCARIAALGERRGYARGVTLFTEDTPGDELFFLLGGRIEVRIRLKNDEQRLATYQRGDSFGEFAAMDRSRRTASAVATTDVEVVVLSGNAFYGLLDREPAIGYVVMRNLCNVLCERLKNANLQFRNAIYWG